MYGDLELLLTTWLPTVATEARAVTDLPADLLEQLPVIRVTRIGGADSTPSLDRGLIDVEYFDATRQAANNGAEDVRHLLRFVLPGHTIAGVTVAKVRTVTGPARRPWDDPNVRRCGATYEITGHSAG